MGQRHGGGDSLRNFTTHALLPVLGLLVKNESGATKAEDFIVDFVGHYFPGYQAHPRRSLSPQNVSEAIKKQQSFDFWCCTLVFPLFGPLDAHRYFFQKRLMSRSAASALKFSCYGPCIDNGGHGGSDATFGGFRLITLQIIEIVE